jgi:hypothetical protein
MYQYTTADGCMTQRISVTAEKEEEKECDAKTREREKKNG